MHQIACLPWSGRQASKDCLLAQQARTACLLSKQGLLACSASKDCLLAQQARTACLLSKQGAFSLLIKSSESYLFNTTRLFSNNLRLKNRK